MKITNKLNLPEAFVNYADKNYEYKKNRYSVTELLNPIREILLTRKHYNEIEEDVCDIVPALFGTAVHNLLESHTTISDKLLPEISVEYNIDNITLSGRLDLLNLESDSIEDYKTCSVSKITKNDFTDWKLQGLMYAWLVFKTRDIIIRKLRFYALMKDWSKIKSANSSNYPASPVYVWEYDVQDSDYDYIEKFIKEKLELIKKGELLPCTSEERWYTGTEYAVYKNSSDKRASYITKDEKDAHNYIINKLEGTGIIQVRKGENLKCKHYCKVCKYCDLKED